MVNGPCGATPAVEDPGGSGVSMSVGPIVEGFAVETREGMIFTVKGLLHPPGRLIAYVRYAPDPEGTRRRDGTRYRRLYQFDEQEAFLTAQHPDYLYDDPIFGLRLQGVPRSSVTRVFDPRYHLAGLRGRGPSDPTEETVLAFDELLLDAAEGVSPFDLGISGSVMVDLHRPESDIDFIVYGEEPSREVHRALSRLLEGGSEAVQRPNTRELRALHAAHRVDTPLSFEAFQRMQGRKVNELRFRGRETFLRFVRHRTEVGHEYGDFRYEHVGPATVRARIVDDRLAIFTPCRYGTSETSTLDGVSVKELRQVVSFRGRFSDQAVRGEVIKARGRVERAAPLHGGAAYYRLVVGGRRGDYLLAGPTAD
jgi:hypothetical protein